MTTYKFITLINPDTTILINPDTTILYYNSKINIEAPTLSSIL